MCDDHFSAPQRMSFNTGNKPVAYGPDFTVGRAGAGSIVHQQIWTTKFGNTDQFTLSGRYRQGAWRGDFSTSYADSGNKYRDVDNGFFRGATTRLVSPTVSYDQFGNGPGFANVSVRNAAGVPLDWTRLEQYQVVNVLSVQRDASDKITSAAVKLRRSVAPAPPIWADTPVTRPAASVVTRSTMASVSRSQRPVARARGSIVFRVPFFPSEGQA